MHTAEIWQCFCIDLGKSVMVRYSSLCTLLLVLMVGLSSCELVGDIFQAGMTVGIIVVVVIVALLIWLVSRFRR